MRSTRTLSKLSKLSKAARPVESSKEGRLRPFERMDEAVMCRGLVRLRSGVGLSERIGGSGA